VGLWIIVLNKKMERKDGEGNEFGSMAENAAMMIRMIGGRWATMSDADKWSAAAALHRSHVFARDAHLSLALMLDMWPGKSGSEQSGSLWARSILSLGQNENEWAAADGSPQRLRALPAYCGTPVVFLQTVGEMLSLKSSSELGLVYGAVAAVLADCVLTAMQLEGTRANWPAQTPGPPCCYYEMGDKKELFGRLRTLVRGAPGMLPFLIAWRVGRPCDLMCAQLLPHLLKNCNSGDGVADFVCSRIGDAAGINHLQDPRVAIEVHEAIRVFLEESPSRRAWRQNVGRGYDLERTRWGLQCATTLVSASCEDGSGFDLTPPSSFLAMLRTQNPSHMPLLQLCSQHIIRVSHYRQMLAAALKCTLLIVELLPLVAAYTIPYVARPELFSQPQALLQPSELVRLINSEYASRRHSFSHPNSSDS
jgi:hypothetical protein